MLKRILFFTILSCACFGFVYGQQLTRIAVIDLPRVYTEFFAESKAVRDFEERTARVQRDIDRMQKEIQDTRTRLANAIQENRESDIIRLETEINRKTENLRNFYQARTAELDNQRKNLMQDNSFLKQVQDEIRIVAESEGYTHVFDIKNTPGMVWFSASVDVTDKLIASLRSKSRN